MAKKKTGNEQAQLQRPAAEVSYADELDLLEKADGKAARPHGWRLTPISVLKFVLGDDKLKIASKFTLDRNMEENLKLYEEILQERHRAAVPKGWK